MRDGMAERDVSELPSALDSDDEERDHDYVLDNLEEGSSWKKSEEKAFMRKLKA